MTNVEEIACPLPPSICRDKMALRLADRCIGWKKQVIQAERHRKRKEEKRSLTYHAGLQLFLSKMLKMSLYSYSHSFYKKRRKASSMHVLHNLGCEFQICAASQYVFV